ncbi:MAG: bifunctional (p)ppGpp synthetase/guanosine-3',5'-bis(diphosphate) 3'-pyrophosphohydrolase [Gammaproteobacteria bacterium]|nr:bifunctional (p)ppGpp synthetase/guanosine-3',5'-bis(diphosphate) 3'-pyrophosphohydrolase [Gammaproteobacteria bacterium]
MAEDRVTTAIPIPLEPLQTLVSAIHFATDKHRQQRRKDADETPYINHPLSLLHLLVTEGSVTDPATLCAAVLHDTIEDTETTEAELYHHFGQEIASVVMEVSDDKNLPKTEQKRLQIEHAPHISERAKLVKLADKICNLRDLLTTPPVDWPSERKLAYFHWASEVVDGIRGAHPKLEELFDGLMAEVG